ncbi:MAG: hypothetical protein V7L22_33060 [Nostoc sp.]
MRYINHKGDQLNQFIAAIAKTMPAAGYAYAFRFCSQYLFYYGAIA